MQPADQAGIATHLILPAWWVKAYEVAMQCEGGIHSAMEQASESRLAPALNPIELNSLAVVVANLQQQILAGRHRTLKIDLEEHLKHAGSFARSRLFSFERIVQQLLGVRALARGENGSFRSFPLFTSDRWLRRGDQSGHFEIELTPSALGLEQILGFADAHLDLVRYARGEAEACDALGQEPPLSIWRSVWLELQGIEQVLFMRLERGMQWDFRWLQLEGVFGLPLGELFAGLNVPEARSADGGPALAQRLKLLMRLGRKLVSHGFLNAQNGSQYLALSEADDEDLLLVWQMSRERLLLDVMRPFRTQVASFMVKHLLDAQVDTLSRMILPEASYEMSEEARGLWALLRDKAEPSESSLVGLHFEQSRILSPQALFFELCLRRSAHGPWPVPETLVNGPVGSLTASASTESALERFMQFSKLIDEAPEFVQVLREVPLASLASPVSRTVEGFTGRMRQAMVNEATIAMNLSHERLPRFIPGKAEEAERGQGVVSAPIPPKEPESVKPVASASLSGALAARMRKTAADELQRMEANDPERYRSLKKAYVDSLDEPGRRLIVDIQKRMQPAIFEDHLRQRLVRFMVENPGSWRSADTRVESSRA